MAGPEPYPQVKWTVEQEAAYAEGRKSAQGDSRGQPSRSGAKAGSGRKRYVRTDAGSRRYHVPIGAEIGSARNAKAAKAQEDTESTDRYGELVGADQKAQAAAMRGLDDSQLQRLSQVAYSFASSNPDVVRLRVGVANELKRRGMSVNDFGGLGGGSARTTARKPATASPGGRVQNAMAKMYGPKQLSVPQLRRALGAFSRVPSAKRQAVARYLVRQAIELSATNLVGESIVVATNDPQVIELAGKWKHGYIPLDAVALNSKMKGRTGGKQWWSGGKGSGGSKGKAVRGVPKPNPGGAKTRKAKFGVMNNQATGRRYAAQSRNPADRYAKESSTRHLQEQEMMTRNKATRVGTADAKRRKAVEGELDRRGAKRLPEGTLTEAQERYVAKHKAEAPKKRPGVSGGAEKIRKSVEAGKKIRAAKATRDRLNAAQLERAPKSREPGSVVPSDRTNVVKSSSKPERDSTMNEKPLAASEFRKFGREATVELEDNRGGKVQGKIRTVTVNENGISIELETPGGAVHRYNTRNFVSVKRSAGGSKADQTATPGVKRSSNPTLPPHTGVVGKKVAGAPEGTQAFTVTGTVLHDTVLFDSEGKVLGFTKKRSGTSYVGRSGQATLKKQTGFAMYDSKGNPMGDEYTRARALQLIKTRAARKAAPVKTLDEAGGSLGKA